MGSTYGKIFNISTFGESHGKAIGVVIDGCPAGVDFDEAFIQSELDKRKPGQSRITTQRKEGDSFQVLSGVFEGKTTGTPLALVIFNEDQRSKDYSHIADKYRPSHADYTYDVKYGIRDYRGGGRSSARETAARVAAGAVAKLVLQNIGVEIKAYVKQVGRLKLEKDYAALNLDLRFENAVRCPDPEMAQKMFDYIDDIRKQGDSIGGVISCVATGVPAGWGEPAFDKLHAEMGKAMLSINAVKGFEYGSGFDGTALLGSEHNDPFTLEEGKVKTKSNHAGGILGGISSGEDIYFNVAFKPTATIMRDQESVNSSGESVVVSGKGRHDPCVLPRAVPIVEAMTALVLVDFYLRSRADKL
ncbi:chorismate synthase [Marinilongibacter aquaticus]|uniref:chorismate synthase n=1 Tax=Marinilongibacter aquaticus TaxID=2975157 RepID=UPI0021BDCC65|nr:chorismate synthase [Marinilongibacter aquaticus]UBM58329.1 chorismate synthase [Marinilongibacter aquaticus]